MHHDQHALARSTYDRAATALVLSALLFLLGVPAARAADEPVDLFRALSPIESPVGPAHELSPAAVEATPIAVAVDEIATARPTLRIPSLSGAPARLARMSDFEYRGKSNVAWRGWIEATDGTKRRVTLTVYRGRVAGLVYTDEGAYEIRPLARGRHALLRLDGARFPACEAADAHVDGVRGERAGLVDPRSFGGDAGLGDPSDRIDVLGVYTPDARDGAGGVTEIEATVQSAVDVANTAFIDSEAVARLRLVYTGLIDYAESGDISTDLAALAADGAVAALRDQYAADLVGMTVEDGGGGCGIAYVMRDPGADFEDSAFQVTDRGCAVGNLSYAHEHGHNLGLEHDPANGPVPADASYEWSYGHFVDGSYRTVMSYSGECVSGCTRVAHFSNPDVDHAGAPTGVAGERDNAQTLDLTAPIAANFRAGVSLAVSGSCPGPLTLTVEGASPGASLQVWKGTDSGSFTVPNGACAGTSLGLHNPRQALTLTADASGSATFSGSAPGAICGHFVQVLDLDRCATSGAESLDPLAVAF